MKHTDAGNSEGREQLLPFVFHPELSGGGNKGVTEAK